MKFQFSHKSDTGVTDIQKTATTVSIIRDGKKTMFSYVKTGSGYRFFHDKDIFETYLGYQKDDVTHVFVNGHEVPLRWQKSRYLLSGGRKQTGSKDSSVRAVMPGQVTKIYVRSGDVVKKGDPLIIIEAMKMENDITSPVNATVDNVAVSKGTSVETGELLISFKE